MNDRYAELPTEGFLYGNKELARITSVKNDVDKYIGLKIINTALPLFTHGFIFRSAEHIFLAQLLLPTRYFRLFPALETEYSMTKSCVHMQCCQSAGHTGHTRGQDLALEKWRHSMFFKLYNSFLCQSYSKLSL